MSSADAGMRWASDKQLHVELALIRAVQTLEEIRISDVITALGKGGITDATQINLDKALAPAKPVVEETPQPSTPETSTPEPISVPEPALND